MFVNITTKSAQHAHARMIAIIVEKSRAVCKSQKNPLSDSQTAPELHWKP